MTRNMGMAVAMLDQIIYWVGAVSCVAGGVCIVATVLISCALLSNRAANRLLESYGGWKVFLEYRDWYNANKRAHPTATNQNKGDGDAD